MNHHPFFYFLKERSQASLPGIEAHMKMSPVPLNPDYVLPGGDSELAHPSGVMVLLFPNEQQELKIVLTLRTNTIRHAGQISFPGGRAEPGEELKQTALRETEEEVGISQNLIHVVCSLSPFTLHKSGNRITPFVGFLRERPKLYPNPEEVQEVFSCKLDKLMDDHTLKRRKWSLMEDDFEVPYWDIHDVPLWGATAMMLSELLELYSEYKSTNPHK